MARRNRDKRSTGKFFVFTEGETEINYIREYIKTKKYPLTRFVVIQPEDHVPYGLLKETKKKLVKQQNKTYSIEKDDIFWLVFDRDQHDRIPNTYEEARKTKKVGIAFSSICFEIWLMLHFHCNIKPFPSCDKLLADRKFKDYIGDYEKAAGKIFDFVNGSEGVKVAIKNAEILVESAKKGNPGRQIYEINPYCNLHLLIKAIDEFFIKEKELCKKSDAIKALIVKSTSA